MVMEMDLDMDMNMDMVTDMVMDTTIMCKDTNYNKHIFI
jgi:hypothetical protein